MLTSHGGLTYGGLVMGNEATTKHVVELFAQMKEHLQEAGIDRVVYKAIPAIYHRLPAEEDLYAIHSTCRYRLLERDVSSAIIPDAHIAWKKDRRHGLKKALQSGLRVSEQPDYERFWEILTDNLREKYGATPVHSLSEILLLRNRFPKNIRLFTALRNNELLGGCVVYVANSRVAHSQYISATDEGKRLGAIDLIVSHLLENVFPQISFFDFGKSTEQQSDRLNDSLIYQKEGFGGRAICYDTYEWEVNSE